MFQIDAHNRVTHSFSRMFTTSNDLAHIHKALRDKQLTTTVNSYMYTYNGNDFASDYEICTASQLVCLTLKSEGITAMMEEGPGHPTNAAWNKVVYANPNSQSWKLLEDGRIEITDTSGGKITLGNTMTVTDNTKTFMYF